MSITVSTNRSIFDLLKRCLPSCIPCSFSNYLIKMAKCARFSRIFQGSCSVLIISSFIWFWCCHIKVIERFIGKLTRSILITSGFALLWMWCVCVCAKIRRDLCEGSLQLSKTHSDYGFVFLLNVR